MTCSGERLFFMGDDYLYLIDSEKSVLVQVSFSLLPREPHHSDLLCLSSTLQHDPPRRQGQSESVGWKNLTSFQIEEYREECVDATKIYGKHKVSCHFCLKLSVLSRGF